MTGGILFCLVLWGFIAIQKIHGDSQKRPIPLVTYLLPPLDICGLKKWKLGKMVAESCYINQVILEITILLPRLSEFWDYKHIPLCPSPAHTRSQITEKKLYHNKQFISWSLVFCFELSGKWIMSRINREWTDHCSGLFGLKCQPPLEV